MTELLFNLDQHALDKRIEFELREFSALTSIDFSDIVVPTQVKEWLPFMPNLTHFSGEIDGSDVEFLDAILQCKKLKSLKPIPDFSSHTSRDYLVELFENLPLVEISSGEGNEHHKKILQINGVSNRLMSINIQFSFKESYVVQVFRKPDHVIPLPNLKVLIINSQFCSNSYLLYSAQNTLEMLEMNLVRVIDIDLSDLCLPNSEVLALSIDQGQFHIVEHLLSTCQSTLTELAISLGSLLDPRPLCSQFELSKINSITLPSCTNSILQFLLSRSSGTTLRSLTYSELRCTRRFLQKWLNYFANLTDWRLLLYQYHTFVVSSLNLCLELLKCVYMVILILITLYCKN